MVGECAWFTRVQDKIAHFWAPSPSANETSLELIMDANLKNPYASYVMIVLRLMTYLLRNKLGKEAELLIILPVGMSFWKMEHH